MTLERICQKCRFFEAGAGFKEGYCRRYAPRPVSVMDDGGQPADCITFFPRVHVEDFCGEWEGRQ